MTIIVIGVDLGAKTGVAWLENGKLQDAFTFNIKSATDGEEYYCLHEAISGFITTLLIRDTEPVDKEATEVYVFVEEPFYNKKWVTAFRKLSGYEAILMLLCEQLGCPYAMISNQKIKSHFGVKSKSDMMAKAKELSGRDDLTQDEADAILVAFYGWEMIKKGGSK